MSEPKLLESGFWNISDFACSCGAEGKERMSTLFEWTKKYHYGHDDRMLADEWEKHQDFFLTGLLYDLTEFNIWLDSVPLDPGGWGAIIAATGEKVKKPLSLFIQFDRFEDGLMLLLKRVVEFYDNKEDSQIPEGDDTDGELQEEKA